ncbi:MAG: YkgJ family cysteine cluster protein [Phycisphaerae bacterium]|nr:YkgJ family cysteine cluster protein [Phycisphaerae bacterium]
MSAEDPTNKFREAVLKDAPRLKQTDAFQFGCHPGVSCFNQCCADVNIFLTPYDVIRMKNRLGIPSNEFLDKYTIIPFTKEQRLPVVVLKMRDETDKRCPFVTESGCGIYEDRPWACRMYPLGMASPGDYEQGAEEFFFLIEEEGCKGFQEQRTQTVAEWLADQGIAVYNEMGDPFRKFTTHPKMQGDVELTLAQMDMVHMTCYDVDRFRRFVFESTLLEKLDIAADRAEAMRDDDVELMKFAMDWLRFSLCREPTLPIKQEFRQKKEQDLAGVIAARRDAALKQKQEKGKSG